MPNFKFNSIKPPFDAEVAKNLLHGLYTNLLKLQSQYYKKSTYTPHPERITATFLSKT